MPVVTSRRFAGETVHCGIGVLSFAEDGELVGDATPEIVDWCRRCKDIQVDDEAEPVPEDQAPGFDVQVAKRPALLHEAKRLDLGLHATATNEELRAAIAEATSAPAQELAEAAREE